MFRGLCLGAVWGAGVGETWGGATEGRVAGLLLIFSVAVLLENFSIFYNEDDTELNHAVVRDFKLNWLYYDKSASVSHLPPSLPSPPSLPQVW